MSRPHRIAPNGRRRDTGATQFLAYFGALAQERWNVEVLLLEVGDHRVSQRVHGYAFRAGGSHLTRRCLLHHNGWTHWLRAILGLRLLGKRGNDIAALHLGLSSADVGVLEAG